MRKALVRLVAVCRPFWPIMAGIFGFIAIERAVGLTVPQLTGRLVDAVTKLDGHSAVWLIATIGLVLAIENVIGAIRWYVETRRMTDPMRGHVIKMIIGKLCSLSISQHRSENSGIRRDVISNGQGAIHSLISTFTYNVVPLLIEVTIVVGMLLWTDWRIGVTFLVGASIFILWSVRLNSALFPKLVDLQKTQRAEGKRRGEILSNIALVITCGQEERATHESEESRRKSYDHHLKVWTPYVLISAARNMVLTLTRVGTSGVGAWLVFQGTITIGQAVAVWSLANSALSQVGSIGAIWRDILDNAASLAKLMEVLDMESDVPTPINPIRPERFRGDIECRKLMLIYRGKDGKATKSPSLKNVSFRIAAGQRVAIIGRSGAGKSTLIHALLRGQELDAGTITVDGIDIRKLDPIHWRRRIGVVPQTPYLFDEDLRYNITFGLERTAPINDEEIRQACLMASLDDLLPRLSEGFDTKIGERGIRLSGGEQQRVGIARALIKDPDILIFDEATSNLDPENEERIRQAIQRAGAGRTTIIIAHRFSTIRDADLVLVMEQGHLVDSGSHQQLAERSPVYQRLIMQHQLVGGIIAAS